MQINEQPLYTLQFWLLCISTALFSGSFNMMIPELPNYLTSLGGEDYKGLIISLFTLMAGLSRPFSGKLTDVIGRIPVMIFGTLVCVICSLIYPLIAGVGGFLLLRFFHGFSTGFKPTATTAFVADIAPLHRRGEALGLLGISMNLGASITPPIGSWITTVYSIDVMFYVSSALAVFSIIILLNLKETLPNPQPFTPKVLRLKKDEWIEWHAIPPAIVIMLCYFSYGMILTITPDQAEFVGMENKGLFFTSITLASMSSRIFAGKISDRLGRLPVLKVGSFFIACSLTFFGFAENGLMVMIAAACLGFSSGIVAPAAFAWTVDRAVNNEKGKALATAYIFLEIGIGGGAILSAWIYNNKPENFMMTYAIGAAICFCAFLYLQIAMRKKAE